MNNQKGILKILPFVFGIAGLSWIIGGICSISHIVLYPLIGLVNLGIAWFCWQSSK